jgi:type IV pilus assembly protein PilB
MQPARLRLGQLLVDARILSESQLEQVLALQKTDGRKLGTLLVESGMVSETQLTQILSQQLSVPWVSLYHIDFSRELLNLVRREAAEKYGLVPIYVRAVRGQGDTLYVAMEDPMNEEALRVCSEFSGLPARAMIAAPTAIRKAVQTYYGGVSTQPPPAPPEVASPVAKAPPEVAPPVVAAPAAPQPAPPEDLDESAEADDELQDRPTPVIAYAASTDNGLASTDPVVAPFMVDEPTSARADLGTIPEKETAKAARREEEGPTLEVHEVDMTKRKRRQVQLTLLDGTTIKLPSGQKKRTKATRTDPPSSEDTLTAADLLAALRAAAHGADAAEILGDNLRWEKMFAAILSLLLRKHLIMEKELIDELKKI